MSGKKLGLGVRDSPSPPMFPVRTLRPVSLPFIPSDAALLTLQAAVVLGPRPAPEVGWFRRLRGPAWALVPIASIVIVVFAIRFVSDTATGLTYLALVAVPPLAAAALGGTARGSTPPAALGAVALSAVAWAVPKTLVGEASAALLSGLSCVTLAVLLDAVTPRGWMKVGIVLMAAADTWLVVTDLLQGPNQALIAAHPLGGLPRLQSELFGSVTLGYGDLFVAALLGSVLCAERRRQRAGALLTLAFAGVFDLLFFFVSELPATVPVALALIVLELWAMAGRRGSSVDRRRSRPGDATPQPET
jgi:hypothetical protein